MFKWLENRHKRDDEKFMRCLQDPDYADKQLLSFYEVRAKISVAFILFILIFVGSIIFWHPSNDSVFFWLIAAILIMYTGIDSQIKMLQMIKYVNSRFESEKETKAE
jgi:hypothetical protein